MTLSYVTQSLDTLTQDLQTFKQKQEDKLDTITTNLETKHESLWEEKMTSVNTRLSKLEAVAQRPAMGIRDQGTCEEKAALVTYVRKGDSSYEEKALSTETNPGGGYLIPQVIAQDMVHTITAHAPLRALARVTTISTDALEVLLDKDPAQIGWVSETQNRDETATPEVARVKIPVHELYAKPRATQKLLDDAAINVETWLVDKVSTQMAHTENDSFINGDGVGKPKGFLTYPSAPTASWEWGKLEEFSTLTDGAFGELGADVLIDTLHAMKPQYLDQAAWIMSRSTLAAVRKVRSGDEYLFQPSFADKGPGTLLGYPVVVCDDMPALVAGKPSKSIVFANLKEAYQIVDREGIHVLRDPYSAKPYVEFYTTRRVGGDVVNFEAIKIVKFAA